MFAAGQVIVRWRFCGLTSPGCMRFATSEKNNSPQLTHLLK
jgi:hypothetical protein